MQRRNVASGGRAVKRLIAIGSCSISLLSLLVCFPRALSAGSETGALDHGGLRRTYLLHIPAKLPAGQPAPLLLVFHGGAGEGKGTASLTRFRELADREGFLVAFPDGIERQWYDGRVGLPTKAHREKIDDVGFIDKLIDAVHQQHPVDPKRVYATGISNGGMFAHYLAALRSERIAAIAPVVGGIADPFHLQFKPSKPVSVLIIQGTEDPLTPYAGGGVSKGARGKVISTDEAVRKWVEHNGCKGKSVQTALPDTDRRDGCTVVRTTWTGGRDGTEVVLYKIAGGGHTWPSGPQYLPKALIGNVCRDFDATAVIWEFFKTHPKP
jgi:polyhydroxybutyrate depolymerase